MSLGVVLVYKVHIIGTDEFDIMLPCQFDEDFVHLLLDREGLAIGTLVGVLHFMALQFQVVILTKDSFIPTYGFLCPFDVSIVDLPWNLACNASRTDDEAFVKEFQVVAVGSGFVVEPVNPRTRNQFDQVVIALLVLRQHDKMIAHSVAQLLVFRFLIAWGNVHFTADNRFEGFQTLVLALLVKFVACVAEFLDTHHVTMIGDGHASHAVGRGFVEEFRYTGLSVE